MIRFILASQSPRRRELLAICGYPFEVIAADVDESSVSDPDPGQDCVRTAQLKAHTVGGQLEHKPSWRTIILAADTAVTLDQQMLGKPTDPIEAEQMLRALRARTHEVYTGVAVVDLETAQEVTGYHTAVVTMRDYSDQDIEQYILSGDPLDKAGAYGIQHSQFRPVAALDGCYLGVMGLSVCHLLTLLDQLNIPCKVNKEALWTAHQGFPCPIYNKIAGKDSK